ncbi:FMN-linked oxidoreductase [Teratosphaeria nubilosa]|uniref:FMN-linked oxidoreductase n=1 Tax=Teratosphaeria nubilosa TaxID=161662 RepID=A0A6G1L5Y3_9PEZI|nr:FMN-linked oxidoreductase [Teratosphaeria nubilosa]
MPCCRTGPSVDTTVLKDSITFPFSGRIAKNRFLKAPMTERLCHFPIVGSPDEDITSRGYPTAAYKHLYQRWGEGEIGVIVAGNLMLRYDALEAYGNPILQDDHDGRVAAFREVADVAKRHGSLFIAQLSHPGRQGSAALNPSPVSASDVHLKISWAGNSFNQPRALAIPEIKENVKFWGETAYLCHQAGFDGVQVHCAHGYLLAQFLSLTTNKRTDEYGGDFTNRSRIIFEIIDEIRRRVPDPSFIICVKLNSVEFQPGGQTPEDCKNLCLKLEEAGVDFVDLSGGTFESRAFEHKKESTKKRESYFIEFAEMIRPLLKKTKVYVTGGFRTAGGMVRAVEDGACDGVGIGRPLGAEPYLCKEILEGKVQGAIENLMPLPLNTQGTGTQLQQVGKGDAMISDWSDEGEVKRWIEANEKETDRKEKLLPKVDSSGYPAFKAEAGFAYVRWR